MARNDPKPDKSKKPQPKPQPDVLPPDQPADDQPGTSPGPRGEHRSLEGPNIKHSGSPESEGAACAEDQESLKSDQNRRKTSPPEHSRPRKQEKGEHRTPPRK